LTVYSAVKKRRSIRRFKKKRIPYFILRKLVDVARLAPTAANFQPLEFVIVDKKKLLDDVFQHLRWAGYLKKKGAPEEGRRPVAYIVVLVNKNRCKFPQYVQTDLGAAAENILLTAVEEGLGACWIGAMDKKKISGILQLPKFLSAEYTIALGYPDEISKIEVLKRSHKYYKDKNAVMHVPKRKISAVLHRNGR